VNEVLVHLRAFEVELQQLVVHLGERLQHGVAVTLGQLLQVFGDVVVGVVEAQRLGIEVDGLHADEIDHAGELVLAPDGYLHGNGGGGEPLADHVHHVVEVGAGAIHLVDEGNAGGAVAVGLVPHSLRLWFHPADRAENANRTGEHAQGTFHFGSEVHVPGRVDDINLSVFPEACGYCRRDGDAALALLFHPVHERVAVMHLAHLMQVTRVVQNTFRSGRFTCIDVSHDPDITDSGQGGLRHHRLDSSRVTSAGGRRPCWPPPSCGYPRASSRWRLPSCRQTPVRRRGGLPWSFPNASWSNR